MKVGDLVSIERASIGVARGSLAMITGVARSAEYIRKEEAAFSVLYHVQLIGKSKSLYALRYFSSDLKVIHEA